MKIKDLIEKLKQFNPEQSVACYTEDEGLKHDGGPVQIFEILNISESEAESSRLNDGAGKPWLKFGKSDGSSKFVLIEITSDA
ncbi:hypothetical protein QQF45_00250 [Halopseudomonas aestusnigri]|jgi:hypothetical protein|uniref:hypothetical protein n=1 Tax=Halopseudomonas aestusnigri TaxID=857252 RepID=UPI002554D083|nr:hypothetical protein [Halopseudomonas aestusnigri]MDL2197486.1 hypothetical protein [Halopseudomonas aestusnigri]